MRSPQRWWIRWTTIIFAISMFVSGTAQLTPPAQAQSTPRTAFVHLFFVDGTTCSIADSIVCLTPNQTMTSLASELDPGVTGYLIAVAIDSNGCQIRVNPLIGDEYVKFDSGYFGIYGAEQIAAAE